MGLKLNRKLVLEEAARVPDGAGGFSEIWTPLGELWAEVSANSGREAAQNGVAISIQKYRIVVCAAPIGSPSRPRPDQRFREGQRTFLIQSVSDSFKLDAFLMCQVIEEELV